MHLQAVFLFAKEIGKFCINRIESYKYNILTTMQKKNSKPSAVKLETIIFTKSYF